MVLRTGLNNLDIIEDSINLGASGEDITNMLNSLTEQTLPARLEIRPSGGDIEMQELGKDWSDMTPEERATYDDAIFDAANVWDTRVTEPLGPEDVAGRELGEYAQQLRDYHYNVLRQDLSLIHI